MRRAAALLLAGACLPQSASAQDASASAQDASARPAQPTCELHVTAVGYPNRAQLPVKSSAFIKVTPPPPGGAVFTTATVAAALDEAGLRALWPDAQNLTIIRHDALFDLDARKLDGARLHTSPSVCYADLVVENTYAVLTDEVPQERLGVISAVIVGGSRLVTSFRFQAWQGQDKKGAGKPVLLRKKVDAPLAVTTKDVNSGSDAARASLAPVAGESLRQFAAFVANRRAR